ncbi:hypothetical protein HYPSUDRAFT_69051 [Hypholoma sublateritium FD-334 SS-4]|uniref:BTB domain-containing protein n=1 Tax=Hypholoma sublateritium (strain FD-334 SS-4) TaxID=945553 RepID=A0A0D2NLJ4_HYPSF|nr:hypothetical protein HYPSUDRAFT_69051 [Hypholoma sublateritium FD-334 SS-4]
MEHESTPPAKRKRGDTASEPATVPRRSEKFWFDDGSVVLQVESTRFRVHRSILANYSPVFDDLFKVPQPEGDKSDWVDGCPTVCMSGDTTDDWDSVLSFIYKPSSLPTKWPDVRKLAGMMRLGKKYQLDDIFQEALTRLEDQFPQELDADHSTDCISDELHSWIESNFEDIACIGEEMALWGILPFTYYLAVSVDANIPEFLLSHPNLSYNSVRSVTYGSSAMWKDVVERSFGWAKPTETIIPTKGCPTRHRCTAARTLVLGEVFTQIGSQDLCIALDNWEKDADHEFCVECHKTAKQACQDGRAYILNNLGRYFLGEGWEELEQTKSEHWPVIWKSR